MKLFRSHVGSSCVVAVPPAYLPRSTVLGGPQRTTAVPAPRAAAIALLFSVHILRILDCRSIGNFSRFIRSFSRVLSCDVSQSADTVIFGTEKWGRSYARWFLGDFAASPHGSEILFGNAAGYLLVGLF